MYACIHLMEFKKILEASLWLLLASLQYGSQTRLHYWRTVLFLQQHAGKLPVQSSNVYHLKYANAMSNSFQLIM